VVNDAGPGPPGIAKFRIHVDTNKCVGAGQCVLTAPDLFDQDEDGIVVLVDAAPGDDRHSAALKAARLCPAQAIRVDDL
jgi:ferredoxin